MFEDFLTKIGFSVSVIKKFSLNDIVKKSFSVLANSLSESELVSLYQYKIPELTPDGQCSIADKPADKPYDLTEILGINKNELKNNPHTSRLLRLKNIIEELQKITQVDWLGIYRTITNKKDEKVLVKESYYGTISRPEFPLTKEFAKNSNNSTVGLTGKAVIVKDVMDYKGPYYECDNKVRSEFCCPILDGDKVIGIIDAESFTPNFFTDGKIIQIAKVCYDLGLSHICSSESGLS